MRETQSQTYLIMKYLTFYIVQMYDLVTENSSIGK